MGTCFELGKDMATKGDEWAPPFIGCAKNIVGRWRPPPPHPHTHPSRPHCPRLLLGYGKLSLQHA